MLAFTTVIIALVVGATAAPAASATASPTISTQPQLASALNALKATNSNYASSYASLIQAIKPQAQPSNSVDLASKLASAYAAYPSNPLNAGPEILLSGVAGPNDFNDLAAYGLCNSVANVNLVPPPKVIYPKAAATDAPYDIPEAQLRAAINIPQDFTYGKKKPILLLPGTGVTSCENFYTNAYKLLKQTTYADPVFVNIPNNMLDDIQNSAEYVAYAINYMAAITNRNVSTLSWSAGSITAQWAFKYWPSTRNLTSDATNISGDYHGTQLAQVICPPGMPCAPSVLQQFYNSKFISTLRNNGGDSAYVPTTSCWTIYDEIVEPQQNPLASAHINDARGIGTLNAQLQDVCGLTSAASSPNFGHEAALYNAVCYALFTDAVKNNGAANLARSGAQSMCNSFTAPGLDLADVLVTESTIPIAGFNIETYPNKVLVEPTIKAYAAKDVPA